MKIKMCTLTGVDETTNLNRLVNLSESFEFAEWGILYSPARQGTPGRYMSVASIERTLESLPRHIKIALHICGRGVPDLVQAEPIVSRLVDLIAQREGRIQLNFNAKRTPAEIRDIARCVAQLSPTRVITQYNTNNAYVWSQINQSNHQVLFDASGGNGIQCENWPTPLPLECGYAGGLGPGTIKTNLDAIAKVAQDREIWIDMEGKIRVDHDGVDVFCLDRCEQVLRETQQWTSDNKT